MSAQTLAPVEQDRKQLLRQQRKRDLRRFFHTMFSRRIVILGVVGTGFFLLVAIFAPLIAPYDPNEVDILNKFSGMSADHWLGTDAYGRDLFSRIVFGTRVSILTGVIATLMAAVIGCLLGMIASFYGGVVDKLMIAGCDTFMAIPGTALSMALLSLMGGGMLNMAVILCITTIPGMLRMMRASSLSVMSSDYILAAKLSGENKLKIMVKHVLPNSISPIIVMTSQSVGTSIMMESGLSFLGIGIKIPTASWGSIINEARPYLMTAPLYVLAPCICLALLIISLNLLGDGIRDAMDPSLRGA
ncbi:MAG TPA: ABC transporter permease [Candidatus Anaerofilum excrementigallinarum]|nr:ABC transporter permease [Candidatus Anaerofilum excrementigallinarum]